MDNEPGAMRKLLNSVLGIAEPSDNQQSKPMLVSREHEYSGFKAAEPIQLQKPEISLSAENYLKRPIPAGLKTIAASYVGLPSFVGYKAEKTEFSDVEWANEPAVYLTSLTDVEICTLGNYVFSELSTGVSRCILAMLMLLAFQLKAPGIKTTTRIFPEFISEPFDTAQDISYEYLEKKKAYIGGQEIPPSESFDVNENAKSYAFISASMLRMFTRPPENYSKAWNRINDGYKSFYTVTIAVTGINPNLDILRTIHRQFALDPLLKSTLFRILYYTNSSDAYGSIKNFLYKIHLSYTGMHVFPIFVRLCAELKCTAGMVFACLRGGGFDIQLSSIETLLRYSHGSDPRRLKKMWIYGRIFDQNFMVSLQTRNCPELVYRLASALKMARPVANPGVLEIQQLKDLSEIDKRRCALGAERMIVVIREMVNEAQKVLF